MLWSLTYRADDRTLTDAEVDAAHARVVAALKQAPSSPSAETAPGRPGPPSDYLVDPKRVFWAHTVKKTMTKADIIENVYEKVGGFSKKEAAEIVETVFDTIKETLERGEKIKISGFGNFVVRDKNARVGRNPQTGEEITISARRVLTFKPSQVSRTRSTT